MSESSKPGPAKAEGASAFRFLLLVLVMGAVAWFGWKAWQKPEAMVVPVVQPEPGAGFDPASPNEPSPGPAVPAPTPPPPPAAAKPASGPVPVPPTVPAPGTATPPPNPATPATPAPPAEETRRAVPATVNVSAPAMPASAAPEPEPEPATYDTAEAQRLMQALDQAETPEERLRLIANPEKHAAEMERFFVRNGHLDVGSTDPNPGSVVEMTSQKGVQLFRTITRRCPTGAMIRIRAGKDEEPLLDWPLFAQSHNYIFDTFANTTEDAPPTWFTTLCKRSHDFELKQPESDYYFSLDAQGSLSSAGTKTIYVHKDSMAGRYLDSHMNWEGTYLSRLLLGKLKVAGKTLTVVLDCSGTGIER